MKTQLFSLSKIFTEKLLRIPDYQRGYAWTEKQLKDFWGDLDLLEIDKNHYTGVLTLEEVPQYKIEQWNEDLWIIRNKSYAPFFVVDGQQRLTTSILLIQSIIETMKENDSLNYTTGEEIKKKFIFESKDGGKSRSYIFGYEKDNPSYEFLKTHIFNEKSNNTLQDQETIYTHNLMFAKKFFKEKLDKMSVADIECVYKKLTQNLLFNIYSISDDVDVFVAFETMNNRGKPLSHLELLKNRMIYLSTKFDVDNDDKYNIRHSINEAWKSVYHYLGRNKEKPLTDDLFLRHHFSYYFGINVVKEMYPDVEEGSLYRYNWNFDFKSYLLDVKFSIKNVINSSQGSEGVSLDYAHDYVDSLRDSIKTWYYMYNPQDSDYDEDEKEVLYKINKLDMDRVAPIIMAFYIREESKSLRIRLLNSIERVLFLIKLTDISGRVFDVEMGIIDLPRKIRCGDIAIDKIVRELEQKAEMWTPAALLLDNMTNMFKQGFYRWDGTRYLMYEYELSLKKDAKSYTDKIEWKSFIRDDERDHYTLEHIYPQKPQNVCWTSRFRQYSDRERGVLKHSLGNLVPLSKPRNSSFKNKCFEDKKGNNESKIGFRNGSFSEIEVASKVDWNAKEILLRGIKILEFVEKRWKIDLGDKNTKTKILGLEFVVSKEKINL